MGAEQLIREGGGMDADSLWSVGMFINVWIRDHPQRAQRAHKTQKHNLIIDQLLAENLITGTQKLTPHFYSLF